MRVEEITPKIRFADRLEYTGARTLSKTYDSRLIYVTDGCGTFFLEGRSIKIESGILIIFQGGAAYKFEPEPSFTAYAVDFDLTAEYGRDGGFLPPLPLSLFDKRLVHRFIRFENSELLAEPFAEAVHSGIGENVRALVEEYTSGRLFSTERAELMLGGLLLDLARRFSPLGKGARCAEAVVEYVADHYHEPITNTLVARVFGHDPCYLGRIVKLHTGCPIHRLVTKKRVEVGVKLLLTTDLSLDEIAERVGFYSAAHFSKRCKSVTGNSPSYYRKNSR